MVIDKFKSLNDTILELYLKGYSKVMISEYLNINSNKVNYILYKILKVNINYPRKYLNINIMEILPKEKVNRIITLTCFGYNMKEISEDTNMPYNKVKKIIKEANEKKLIKKVV